MTIFRPGGRAVFLDRDGTLVVNVPGSADPERLQFTPGALAGLRRLHEAGYMLLLATNQPGLARGQFTVAELTRYHERLSALLETEGIRLEAVSYCPHDPAGSVPEFAHDCFCRKPKPGLLLDAARKHGIDLRRSWMVGDILDDVEAGHRAGCRSVLINAGNETLWEMSALRNPDHVVDRLDQAARIILANDRGLRLGFGRTLRSRILPRRMEGA